MNVSVLMIDDHPPIIEGYKAILSFNTFGYNISTVAAYTCQSAYEIITNPQNLGIFDCVFIDITLPAFEEKNIHSGEDLVPLLKKYQPNAKIIILTSHTESFIIYKILKESRPDGILIKTDFLAEEFLVAFDKILKGGVYHSATVIAQKHDLTSKNKLLDSYNRQIITLLSQGIKTKNLSEYLNLSKSAIEKRKQSIKEYLGIAKSTDEDILRESRKRGML